MYNSLFYRKYPISDNSPNSINTPDQLKDSNSKPWQVAKNEDSHNYAADLCQENIIHKSEMNTS